MNTDIEKLKNSLPYRMSLGSKELYHSNVWAWLIEQDNTFIDAFVPNISKEYLFDRVSREEGNRDITIWLKLPDGTSKCLVIENKLKSIPYYDQLEKYTEGLGDLLLQGILTGLRKPNVMNDKGSIDVLGKTWSFVSYSELSQRIRAILNQSHSKAIEDNKDVILDYLDNNECVERIVNSFISENRLEQTWNEELNNLGLSDLINKIIGSSFVHYVRRRLAEDKIDIPFFFTAESFHNKKITLDFRLSNWEDYKKKKFTHLMVGVQIEAYQYRRMVDRAQGYCSSSDIFQEYSEKGYFDPDYDRQEKTISFPNDNGNKRPTNLSKKYDKYGETCVYQYSRLEGEDLEFENLYQRIINDLLVASELMSENNKLPYSEAKA